MLNRVAKHQKPIKPKSVHKILRDEHYAIPDEPIDGVLTLKKNFLTLNTIPVRKVVFAYDKLRSSKNPKYAAESNEERRLRNIRSFI
jgi:hypothetical protein